MGTVASQTRGISLGGMTPTKLNSIEYIQIATLGNAADFGDLTEIASAGAACSNSVRGVHNLGSADSAADSNILEYITIATLGLSLIHI